MPVTSLDGVMGVLLYGIAVAWISSVVEETVTDNGSVIIVE